MVIRAIFGIFMILHGLVFLFYFGLSRRLFELDSPLVGWLERSWLFSSFLADSAIRGLASVLYAGSTALFVLSGIGFLIKADWWNPLLLIAAILSSAVVIVFWDGHFQRLPDKGFIGVLINVALIGVAILIERSVIAL